MPLYNFKRPTTLTDDTKMPAGWGYITPAQTGMIPGVSEEFVNQASKPDGRDVCYLFMAPSSPAAISGTKEQFNEACSDGNFVYATGEAYTVTNPVARRAFDANATTVDELVDVLATLIADLKTAGAIK
jgi:hypothetical protein